MMGTTQWLALVGCLIVVSIGCATPCPGGDLDDGISRYTEDSINSYDDLGKPDKNVGFIKLNAKSRAKVRAKDGSSAQTGSGNMNSVVMGPGGTVKGDIYIIDESKGDKTIVVDE